MNRSAIKPDDELRAEVLAELARNPRIEGSEIAASVKYGAVTLHGLVLTRDEKICAELAVKNIEGVRAIANDIEVKSPEEMLQADESVAERVARVLAWYASLRNMDVKATVDDGHVTLTGRVDFAYQKSVVAERVAELAGVSSVTNRIALRRQQAAVE
jgi:osmotically-inducible protein OsmY